MVRTSMHNPVRLCSNPYYLVVLPRSATRYTHFLEAVTVRISTEHGQLVQLASAIHEDDLFRPVSCV